jgi:hypothetical protein
MDIAATRPTKDDFYEDQADPSIGCGDLIRRIKEINSLFAVNVNRQMQMLEIS